MPTAATLERFIAMVERNAHVEAIEGFYAPDASMRENQSAPRVGRDLLVANERRVLAKAKALTSQCVRPVFVDGDNVVIRWTFEFEWHDGTHTRMEELACQRWDGERIAEERFFYDPAQLAPRAASPIAQRIAPCLWFDDQSEEAANFYIAIFGNSRITEISRYGNAGREIHGKPAGSVLAVAFELDGRAFTALNGGPRFKFNEAVSLQVNCETQEEVDYYWEKLSAGGDKRAQQCGWLKDKYGVSWQVVPRALIEMMSSPDSAKAEKAMEAMLQMKKIDVAAIERAVAQ